MPMLQAGIFSSPCSSARGVKLSSFAGDFLTSNCMEWLRSGKVPAVGNPAGTGYGPMGVGRIRLLVGVVAQRFGRGRRVGLHRLHGQIGRALVCTPVTTVPLGCRILL